MDIFIQILPSLIVGIFLAYFNHLQNEREAKQEKKSELRKKEGKLILDMTRAVAKMSYANSMAIIRGKHNGEVEEAVKTYKKVMENYDEFIKDNHISYIEEHR